MLRSSSTTADFLCFPYAEFRFYGFLYSHICTLLTSTFSLDVGRTVYYIGAGKNSRIYLIGSKILYIILQLTLNSIFRRAPLVMSRDSIAQELIIENSSNV